MKLTTAVAIEPMIAPAIASVRSLESSMTYSYDLAGAKSRGESSLEHLLRAWRRQTYSRSSNWLVIIP